MEPTATTVRQPRRNFFAGLLSFSGRARRTDLFLLTVLSILLNLPGFAFDGAGAGIWILDAIETAWDALWAFLWIAIAVRRLHDQDKSGWWMLPLLAVEALLILGFALQPQQEGGGFTINLLSWTLHPVPGAMTTALMLASGAWALATLIVYFGEPTFGPNRYGPDPRLD